MKVGYRMLRIIGYGIIEALFLITLKLEESLRTIRINLSQFSDNHLDKFYETDTQTIPNSTYIPISSKVFQRIMKNAELPDNVSFFDYGSGKGKALILASEMGFKNIAGVELSSELVEISKINIEKYSSKKKKEINIDIICDDATKYTELNGYNVFFINNSFGGNPSEERMVARILRNIEDSMGNNPRNITLIYVHPGISLQLLFNSYSWLNNRKVIRNTNRAKYDNAYIYIFTIKP
jgi:SAM-dependent methyltransferase